MILFISFQPGQTTKCQSSGSFPNLMKKNISLFIALFISNKIEHIFGCLLVICFSPFENYQFIFCYHSSFSYRFISDLFILKIFIIYNVDFKKLFCLLFSFVYVVLCYPEVVC